MSSRISWSEERPCRYCNNKKVDCFWVNNSPFYHQECFGSIQCEASKMFNFSTVVCYSGKSCKRCKEPIDYHIDGNFVCEEFEICVRCLKTKMVDHLNKEHGNFNE